MKRFHLHSFLRFLIWPMILLGAGSNVFSQNSPKFTGTGIPVPPAQTQPWTPPATKLPADVVSAITELFNDGLADPRGCEYREIEIITGDSGNGGGLKTHGWVMPNQGNDKFAVCWNGLVSPVISVGAPADLHKDMTQMLESDRAKIDEVQAQHEEQEKERKESLERSGKKYDHVTWPARWNQSAVPESTSATPEYMWPIKAALLLRLGETDLAEKIWLQWSGYPPNDQAPGAYLALASPWVFTLFDRAISAHMKGDDHLALVSAQALVPIQQAVEAAAAKQPNPNNQDIKPYLKFLKQLPELIADSQRRVDEPPQTPTLQKALPPGSPERIAGLIHDLEYVDARQMGFPGGVNLMDDPNVQALAQEGDAAVEPLLKCMVEDTRLTRSVSAGRPWFQQRTIIPVNQAAFVALSNILHTADFGPNASDALPVADQRKELADKIRAYWQRSRGKSPEEMAYDILNDDHADHKQWLKAASDIIMSANITASPGSTRFGNDLANGGFSSRLVAPGEIVPMRGESLRSKSNPSVSDLLVKRMKALQADEQPQTFFDACNLAMALATWDGKAHLDDLRAFMDAAKSHWTADHATERLVTPLVSLYERRIELGDAQAAADYVDWVENALPPLQELSFARPKVLEPIWRYPDNPVLAGAAEKIFTDPKSPWLPLVRFNDPVDLSQLFQTPLFGVPAFRKDLLRGLHDTASAGTVTLRPDGSIGGEWTGRGPVVTKADPLAPPVGTQVDYRFCDVYANQIAWLDGAPRCELYWPQAERDKAVAASAAFIQKYGDNFKFDPTLPRENPFQKDTARLHFARLDHPATPEDVQAGRAIFSLPGSPRLVKLPELPLEASWDTLKDNVNSINIVDGKPNTIYWTRGTVWQAEEVQVDGKWQRFYGFTGRFHIAKVPASEIEFTDYRRALAPHFAGILSGPPAAPTSGSMFPALPGLKVGDPVPITFKVHNISGEDQTLPRVLTPPSMDGKTFPTGVTLVLLHTDSLEQPESPLRGGGSAKWEPVPPKKTEPLPGEGPVPVIGPDQDYTLSVINLRDLFDLDRTGTYRLYVTTDPTQAPQPWLLSESVFFTVLKPGN